MATAEVTSNFPKFNKNQKALIKRFGLSVDSGLADIAAALFGVAAKDSFQDFDGVTGSKPNSPINAKGKAIINPIQPKALYKRFADRGDKKKFVNRTGELKKVFSETNPKNVNIAPYVRPEVYVRMDSPGSLVFGFAGRARTILLSHSRKGASTRRRPVELAMSKIRAVSKKLIAQKIAMAVKNV